MKISNLRLTLFYYSFFPAKTLIKTLALADCPNLFVAVSVNVVVVLIGGVLTKPLSVGVTLPIPLSIVSKSAYWLVQERVTEEPD